MSRAYALLVFAAVSIVAPMQAAAVDAGKDRGRTLGPGGIQYESIRSVTSHGGLSILGLQTGSFGYDGQTGLMVFAGQRGTQTVSLNAVLNRYEALGFNVDNVRRAQSVLNRQDFTVRQWQFSPPSGLPGPCDLGPCYRDVTGGFNREIGLPDRYTGLIDGLRQGDYQAFNRFRASQCQAMRGSQITIGAGVVAAGAGCGTVLLEFVAGGAAVGGVGAGPGAGIGAALGGLSCLAGSVIVASEAAERQRQARDCNSEYPGPGNWEGSTLPRGF